MTSFCQAALAWGFVGYETNICISCSPLFCIVASCQFCAGLELIYIKLCVMIHMHFAGWLLELCILIGNKTGAVLTAIPQSRLCWWLYILIGNKTGAVLTALPQSRLCWWPVMRDDKHPFTPSCSFLSLWTLALTHVVNESLLSDTIPTVFKREVLCVRVHA